MKEPMRQFSNKEWFQVKTPRTGTEFDQFLYTIRYKYFELRLGDAKNTVYYRRVTRLWYRGIQWFAQKVLNGYFLVERKGWIKGLVQVNRDFTWKGYWYFRKVLGI